VFYLFRDSSNYKLSKTLMSISGAFALVSSAFIGATFPAAPANADVSTYYVATTGTASSTAGGSCASPSFVGTNEVPIQAALDKAALANPATIDNTDVGFSGTYSSTNIVLCAGTWTLQNTLRADANVVIAGSGYSQTIIKGNGSVRLMTVGAYDAATEPLDTNGQPIGFAARVEIGNLTMRNGHVTGTDLSGVGGAIRVLGRDSLKVTRVYFVENSATRGAAIAGSGDQGDLNPAAMRGDFSGAGDVVVDSSAFKANSAVLGGTVEFMRYQRNAVGAVVRNSSFYANSSTRTLNFDFTEGQSIGNSFVANNALGNAVLWGGSNLLVRGNVFAQDDGSTTCGYYISIGSDSISTAPCGNRNGPGVTVSSWSEVKALGLFDAGQIPVQRFSIGSAVRGAWAVSAGCSGNDALGATRPTSGSCDAGPIQQPSTLAAAPAVAAQLTYSNLGNAYSAATLPSNGSGRAVTYTSWDTRICQVDENTGAFTAGNSGTCTIKWNIAGTSTIEDSSGSASVTWLAFPRWSGSSGGYTPLQDENSGNSYFVSGTGSIDRLSASGIFQPGWAKVTNQGTAAAAISSTGDIYIVDWYGTVSKVTSSDVVTDSWQTIPTDPKDNSAIAVNAAGEVFLAGCTGDASTNQITKIAADGTTISKFADLPADSCASDMQIDSEGTLYLVGWYNSGLLRVSADGSTVDFMANSNGSWSQQLVITSNDDVYALAYDTTGFIAKYSASSATFTQNWLALPNGCDPFGIAARNNSSLYVACGASNKFIEINIATQDVSVLYAPDYIFSPNQIHITSGGKLLSTSNIGYALRLNVVRANQAALLASASPVRVGQTVSVSVTGGSTAEANTFATSTSGICTVSSSGVVTALAAGDCSITVARAGDTDYLPVSSSVLTIVVSAAVVPPVVVVNEPVVSTPVVTPPVVVAPPVVTPPVVVPPVVMAPKVPFAGVVLPVAGKVVAGLTLLTNKTKVSTKVTAAAMLSAARAKPVKVSLNVSVAIQASGFRAGAVLLTCIKAGSACANLGVSKAGSTGSVVLPPVKFTKTGTYLLGITNGKSKAYVKVSVAKK